MMGQIKFGVFGAALAAITGVGMRIPAPHTRTHTLKYIEWIKYLTCIYNKLKISNVYYINKNAIT